LTLRPARRYAAELVRLARRPSAHRSDRTVSLKLSHLERLLTERKVQLEAVLEEIVSEAAASLGADRGTLYLVDKVRGELISHVAELPELPQIRLKVGEGVAGWVAESGELLNVPSGSHDLRFADHVDARTGYRTRSLLAAPLWAESAPAVAPIGVLQLLNKRGGGFTSTDEQAIEGIARQVSRLLSHSSLASHLRGHPDRPLSFHFNHIVGDCAAMREVYRRIERAARSSATVLIRGESGTGKELVARAVHDNSERADQPFVVVDLAAMPPELIENELFGHVRGAYTGAHADARGRVQEAEGGTLFLDEIGELPLQLQARLLRLMQDRSFAPVGAGARTSADVRFVCATHRDLETMVARRQFREDLYFRVRVVELVVPPLRERGPADLDRLIDHFLYVFARRHGRPGLRLAPEARALLHARPWPGNVRELQHCLESAVVIEDAAPLPASAFAPAAAPPVRRAARFSTTLRPLREVEADYLRWSLDQLDGNRSATARALGIGRNTLQRKLRDEDS
jgi:Nif-specific regulatory protein